MVKSLPEATEVENDVLTQRQARAAVAMIRLGRAEPVWPLLRHSPNPSLRSYLVNWLKPLGADPKALLARMESLKSGAGTTPMDGRQAMDAVLFHPDTSERRALILALGGYDPDELSPTSVSRSWSTCWRCTATTPTPGFTGRRNGCYGAGSRRRSWRRSMWS